MSIFSPLSACKILRAFSRHIIFKDQKFLPLPFSFRTYAKFNRHSTVVEMSEQAKQELRHIRSRKKRGGKPYRSSSLSIQILGSGLDHTPPSIIVISDDSRYLFNCGEGTQRLLTDCGVSRLMSRLEHVFFTDMSWSSIGGGVGMMISSKKIGVPRVTYYGPEELKHFSKNMQIFAKHELGQFTLDIKPHTEGPFQFDIMKVYPVLLTAEPKGSVSSVPMPTSALEGEDMDVFTESQSSDSDKEEVDEGKMSTGFKSDDKPKVDPLFVLDGMKIQTSEDQQIGEQEEIAIRPKSGDKRKAASLSVLDGMSAKSKKVTAQVQLNTSIAYICKLNGKPGKLLMEKVAKLGIEIGPQLAMFKEGKSVITKDGKEVFPEDVLSPPEPGTSFIVLHCPSVDFIESVVSNSCFGSYQEGGDCEAPAFMFHFCPPHVLKDERYLGWMKQFGKEVDHFVFNQESHSTTQLKCRSLQTKLNLLHPRIFPKIEFSESTPYPPHEDMKVHRAKSYQRLILEPSKGWIDTHIQSNDVQSFLEETEKLPDLRPKLEELQEYLKKQASLKERKQYPELVFLGTGSAMPSRERNVTGILLNLSEKNAMIMDCGEGTYGQLSRLYGERVDDILYNLQCVFISHKHADHHLGLPEIIRKWANVLKKRGDASKTLIVVAPKKILIWLSEHNRTCEHILSRVRFIGNYGMSTSVDTPSRHAKALLDMLNLKKFVVVPVHHCVHAYGLAITHSDGWKLVYSGDTMPCQALVEAGKDADILIHEATFEEGLEEEAKIKKHSTFSQAIDIGKQMNAKFILLTHFSQRYPKVPLVPDELSSRVGIAFDNMRISLSELDLLPLFMPVLKELFVEYIQELEMIRSRKDEKQSLLREAMTSISKT